MRPLTEKQVALLKALGELEREGARQIGAIDLASKVDFADGIRRLGNGAVAGTWSGYVSPALPIGRIMGTLVERGLVWRSYGHRSRGTYRLSDEGRDVLEAMR